MSIKWVEHKDATGFVSFRSECNRFFCARWSMLGVPYWDFWVLPQHRIGFYPSKAEGTEAIEGFDAEGVWPINVIDARSNLAEIHAENARLTEAFKVRQAEKARALAEQEVAQAAAAEQREAERVRVEALQKRLAEEAVARADLDRKAREEAEDRRKADAAAKKAASKKPKKQKVVEESAQPTLF